MSVRKTPKPTKSKASNDGEPSTKRNGLDLPYLNTLQFNIPHKGKRASFMEPLPEYIPSYSPRSQFPRSPEQFGGRSMSNYVQYPDKNKVHKIANRLTEDEDFINIVREYECDITQREYGTSITKCLSNATASYTMELSPIGHGVSGYVHKGVRTSEDSGIITPIAIKIILRSASKNRDDFLHEFIRDAAVSYRMGAADIGPEVYEVITLTSGSTTRGIIVMELFEEDLTSFYKKKLFNAYDVKEAAQQIFITIDNLVNQNFFCVDLKPHNFVVREDEIEVIGVGTSRYNKVRMIDFEIRFCRDTQPIIAWIKGDSIYKKWTASPHAMSINNVLTYILCLIYRLIAYAEMDENDVMPGLDIGDYSINLGTFNGDDLDTFEGSRREKQRAIYTIAERFILGKGLNLLSFTNNIIFYALKKFPLADRDTLIKDLIAKLKALHASY